MSAVSVPNNTTSFIYKGEPTNLGEIPYQVAIKCKDPADMSRYYTFCGGTIISPTKILTAAHCFVHVTLVFLIFTKTHVLPLNDTYAVAATLRNLAYTRTNEHEQWRRLLNVTYPYNYFFPHNDIAILFVTKPFEFNQYVAPIEYATKYADLAGYCLVSGYGQISYNVDSDSLLKTYLQVIPRWQCNINHGRDMFDYICTSKLKADIGLGDSGGPMVCSHTGDPMKRGGRILVGIACGSTFDNMDSFFTGVSSYRRFIESNKCYKRRFQFVYFVFAFIIQNIFGILLHIINLNMCFPEEPNSTNNSDKKTWVPRVMNGWAAVKGDVPYQISFKALTSRYTMKYMTFCGGVIIQPTKLLSAAHCFENSGSDCQNMFSKGPINVYKRILANKYAVAGNLLNRGTYSDDSDENGQWRRLKMVLYPRRYKFPRSDISVVITRKPFIFNKYIDLIPVAIRPVDYYGTCLVSGFGRISDRETSSRLLLAHLELVPTQLCNKLHHRDMSNFVCTSSKVTDVGQGDSGGPLVCANTGDPNEQSKGILVGIVSGHRERVGSFFTRPRLVKVALTSFLGEEVKLGELPHHVMIFRMYDHYQLLYRAYCAGSIITEDRVLTSAKCFLTNRKRRRYNYDQIRVAAGILHTLAHEPITDDTEQWRAIKKVYSQRFYRFPAYSLAVVQTNRIWIFNQFVKRIPYASMDQDFDGVCVTTAIKPTKSWSYIKNVFFEEVQLIKRRKCELTLLRSCRLYLCTYEKAHVSSYSETVGGGIICHGTGDPEEKDETQGILVGVTAVINADLPSLHTRIGLFHRWITDSGSLHTIQTSVLTLCICMSLLGS